MPGTIQVLLHGRHLQAANKQPAHILFHSFLKIVIPAWMGTVEAFQRHLYSEDVDLLMGLTATFLPVHPKRSTLARKESLLCLPAAVV